MRTLSVAVPAVAALALAAALTGIALTRIALMRYRAHGPSVSAGGSAGDAMPLPRERRERGNAAPSIIM